MKAETERNGMDKDVRCLGCQRMPERKRRWDGEGEEAKWKGI